MQPSAMIQRHTSYLPAVRVLIATIIVTIEVMPVTEQVMHVQNWKKRDLKVIKPSLAEPTRGCTARNQRSVSITPTSTRRQAICTAHAQ